MVFKKREKGAWDGIEKAAMMGTNFVAHIIVGLVLGIYCDKWFHTDPWGKIFWLLMGIVAAFRTMYLDAIKVSKSQDLDVTGKEGPAEAPGKKSGEAGPEAPGKDAGQGGGDA